MNDTACQTSCHKSHKILVVDDHPVNLLFMRKALRKIGLDNVDEAASGQEAIYKVAQHDYDLIFMDCQMPEIDGFEASARIRAMPRSKNIPIIAVTADAMKGARERCLESGMNDYISKPIEISRLQTTLNEWLPAQEKIIPVVNEPTTDEKISETDLMDWDHFRMFTDGDIEEEKQLISLFMTYANESLDIMTKHLEDHDTETWRKAAHKLKGSAANLGAKLLAEYCKTAEMAHDHALEDRRDLFQKIQNAYDATCTLLSGKLGI